MDKFHPTCAPSRSRLGPVLGAGSEPRTACAFRPWPRVGAVAALLATLLGADLLAVSAARADQAPAETATATTAAALATAPVTARAIPREYRLDGVVEAINRTTVSAQTQGQVEAILFDVDDFVNKGDIVARLRDTEHQARVAQAAAELKAATAQLEQSGDEFGRVEGLFRTKNVSASAMDQAKAALEGAKARLDAAQAGLEQANEQLEYTRIRAPYSGIVTHRHVEVGETAGPGQPVMTGISLDQLRVTVDVPQSLIATVRERGEVNIHLPDDTQTRPVRVTVFPFADLGSNTFKVRLDLPERTAGLFPGMFVKTGIVTGDKAELTVPKVALVQRSEITAVYVVAADDRVSLRQVRAGRTLGDAVVVLAGLTEGEQVALDPIAAGIRLKAQAAERQQAGGADHD